MSLPPRLPHGRRLPWAPDEAAGRGRLLIRRSSCPLWPPVAHDLSAPRARGPPAPVPAYAQCARHRPDARAEPRLTHPVTPLAWPRLAQRRRRPPLLHLAWSSETKWRASRRPRIRLVCHVRPPPPAVGSKATKWTDLQLEESSTHDLLDVWWRHGWCDSLIGSSSRVPSSETRERLWSRSRSLGIRPSLEGADPEASMVLMSWWSRSRRPSGLHRRWPTTVVLE
jgi:hypothetical protein